MNTIILYSKEKDRELLQELRKALKRKGFKDDMEWNDEYHDDPVIRSLFVTGDQFGTENQLQYHSHKGESLHRRVIPVSRNDFQTMFLLY
jgi:hypothetical protein